ncbi:MAG: transposase [Cetobacterium sp.]|uniref:transposase n=1 Tax=Cetobacterium sp. TaxID=2071632 RepID=UPI003F3576B9
MCVNLQVDIPRDREGQFEPTVVPKYSRDIFDIEDKFISMYGRRMTISEINAHLDLFFSTKSTFCLLK